MNFSQRMGLEPKKKVLQFESMDDELRRELYNTIIEKEKGGESTYKGFQFDDNIEKIYEDIWSHHLYYETEKFSPYNTYNKSKIKEYYYHAKWNKAYDYLEYYLRLAQQYEFDYYCFIEPWINAVLKKHNSAYRIIEGKFAPITNEQELAEISEAANTGQSAIDNHIKKAIALFSDKENRDYTNVIKEAISAVEAAAKLVLKTDKATLGKALNELDRSGKIQPQLKSAIESLYAYTNNPDVGARHSAKSDARFKPDFAEAKFMLVTCSAIVNYLLQKHEIHS